MSLFSGHARFLPSHLSWFSAQRDDNRPSTNITHSHLRYFDAKKTPDGGVNREDLCCGKGRLTRKLPFSRDSPDCGFSVRHFLRPRCFAPEPHQPAAQGRRRECRWSAGPVHGARCCSLARWRWLCRTRFRGCSLAGQIRNRSKQLISQREYIAAPCEFLRQLLRDDPPAVAG